jgi:lactate dehydrogenase-like 2-hydroxyacid dehydrogenase
MTKGKIIVRIGMGFDNVDLKAAAAHNIRVSNVPDYGVEEVADTTLCLLLNLLRKTHSLANLTKEGKWHAAEAKGALR